MTPPTSTSSPQAQPAARTRPVKPLWVALGFVLCALGFVGLVLPGFPGTVWFVLAAASFARGDPRWEAWLLSRPVIGQLVQDYRDGKGMPLRAKWFACICIAVAVSFSLGRIPVLVGQVGWVLVGLFGIYYICLRVPTKR